MSKKKCDACGSFNHIDEKYNKKIPIDLIKKTNKFIDTEFVNIHNHHIICKKCYDQQIHVMSICDTPLFACPITDCERKIYWNYKN